MKRAGEREFIMASAAHQSGVQIWADQKISSAVPEGWAIKRIELRFNAMITNSGVAMTSADEICRAVASFTFLNISDLIDIQNVSGDVFASIARALPPDGADVFDLCPGYDPVLATGNPTRLCMRLPIWYGNSFVPGGDDERIPAQMMRLAAVNFTTAANATWITLGGGTVTGTWDLIAICMPASRLIVPPPMQIWEHTIGAGVTRDLENLQYFYQLAFKSALRQGAPFTLTDQDLVTIATVPKDPRTPRVYTLLDLQNKYFGGKENLILTTDVSRYLDSDIIPLWDGKSEIGDHELYLAGAASKIDYQPVSATRLVTRRIKWWQQAHLDQYSVLFGKKISGGLHTGKVPGSLVQPFTPGLVTLLDITDQIA